MRHVRLGRTGLRVSQLCLGTMTFGLQCDEPTSVAILDRAAAGGITFLDTVGRLSDRRRSRARSGAPRRSSDDGSPDGATTLVVATKCFGAMSARPWDHGALAQAHPRRDRRFAAPAAAPTTSISTSSTIPIRRRRWTRACARSTTSCAPARPATSAARTTSRIRWPRALGRSERAGPGALRLRAAALQPALPPGGARAAPALRARKVWA